MVFFFPSFNVRWIVPLFCPKGDHTNSIVFVSAGPTSTWYEYSYSSVPSSLSLSKVETVSVPENGASGLAVDADLYGPKLPGFAFLP